MCAWTYDDCVHICFRRMRLAALLLASLRRAREWRLKRRLVSQLPLYILAWRCRRRPTFIFRTEHEPLVLGWTGVIDLLLQSPRFSMKSDRCRRGRRCGSGGCRTGSILQLLPRSALALAHTSIAEPARIARSFLARASLVTERIQHTLMPHRLVIIPSIRSPSFRSHMTWRFPTWFLRWHGVV